MEGSIADSGVIVTNAHMARGEESLLAMLSSCEQIEAKFVYIHPELDIALAKADVPSTKTDFPHLPLISADGVRQGEAVLAIGNPGDTMLFTATRGIVSAVTRSCSNSQAAQTGNAPLKSSNRASLLCAQRSIALPELLSSSQISRGLHPKKSRASLRRPANKLAKKRPY